MLTNAQEAQHKKYGDVEKCIHVMELLIDKIDMDPTLIYQAKLGIMKREISVSDTEMWQPIGRKKFLINILNSVVSSKHCECSRGFLLGRFRSFCFHAEELQLGKNIELVNQTMPVGNKINS